MTAMVRKHNNRGQSYVVADFLGRQDWTPLGRMGQALAEKNLPEIHMADCEGGYGKIFGGMEKPERESIQETFIEIITDSRYHLLGLLLGSKWNTTSLFETKSGRFVAPSWWAGKRRWMTPTSWSFRQL